MTVVELCAMDGKGKCGMFQVIVPPGMEKKAEQVARETVIKNIINKPAVILTVTQEATV